MTEDSVDDILLDPNRMIILSLKPRFADAILRRVKTVELRRTEPKISVPTRALIYASTPVQSLLGTCIVTTVTSDELTELWRVHGSRTGLIYREFVHYFKGLDAGTALTLAGAKRFREPIPLVDLRSKPPGFRPPQSFAYVDAEIGQQLLGAAA